MHPWSPVGWPRWAPRAAACAGALGLSACAEASSSGGATTLWATGVALVAVGALAHAWGRQAGRATAERELRQARAAARLWQGLQDAHVWRTDGQHRLVSWQPPGLATSARGPLFAVPDTAGESPTASGPVPALRVRLQAQQPFSGLRVEAAEAGPVDPDAQARWWAVAGTPEHDDRGAFNGFVGTARPVDEQDGLALGAAALPALLACAEGAAIVATAQGPGWRVGHLNAAARSQWPALTPGAPLDGVLAALPEPVRLAAQRMSAPIPSDASAKVRESAGGWHFESFGPLPDGTMGLVLMQRVAAAPAAAENSEGEQFSFTVSHDLRAPIRVVEGFTRIVKEDYGRLLDRVGNDHLDRVLGAAARMNLMIDALLTLAKLSTQPLAQQTVNLSQMAGWVADELVRGAPERLAEIEIEPGLVTRGDPTLLRLVLENLLGNAWKYSARCARAQISLRQVPHGSGMAYVVRDNGAGFDMRSADRLFGLFQRLHSASEFPGHGVGLASVRRIVRRHGGEIWAEAEAGRGAAFYFTLGA